MSEYYFKLHFREAQKLAKKIGIKLPKTRKQLKIKDKKFIKDIWKHRVYLNKARSIWIQPCHFYDGIKKQFSYEISHVTSNSAFSRFANKYRVPLRVFTY